MMKSVNKSVLIWYSPAEMFSLVEDVARYPEFLPWCEKTSVLAQDSHGITAEIGLSFGGIRQAFTTKNSHIPERQITMALVKGPFSKLDGTWNFNPVSGETRACRVELCMNYGFSNFALSKLVGPVFDKIAGSLVDAFVKRAEQMYG